MPSRIEGTVSRYAEEVLRARRLLIGLYSLTGVAVATWLSRLPSIRTELGLSTFELSSLLLVGSVGALVMVVFAGALTTRWGSRRMLLVAAVLFALGNTLVGLGPGLGSVGLLAVGVLLASSSYALANVPMNLESVVIERAMGRTVVPQFHAAFSIGSVGGSLVGAAISWAQVPVGVHFAAMSALSIVIRVLAVPGAVLPTSPSNRAPALDGTLLAPRGASLRTALAAWREPRTLLIGIIVMFAALSDGAATNWLTIAVVDGFDRTEAVAAVVFGAFVGSMTTARLLGSRLIDRYGPVAVLVGSGVSGLLGLLLFGLAAGLPLAVLGVACWGLGTGLLVPIAMAAVAWEPLHAAGRVAVLSAFGSVSMIVTPPAIGLAAAAMGARNAFMLVGVGMAVSILLSRTVRRPDDDAPRLEPAAAAAPVPGSPVPVGTC